MDEDKKNLEEQVKAMETKAEKIFSDRSEAEQRQNQVKEQLEEKKNDFNKMKRDMKEIEE